MMSLGDSIRTKAAELAAQYLASAANVGLSLGVLANGEQYTFGFGRVIRNSDRAPDENTLYEIASVTKVFTATLLAEMATRGEVRLDQPVAELLPSDVAIPSYGQQPITLAQLAEHTSSLPRLPSNLFATVTDDNNPYKDYQVSHLYAYLNGASISFPPGSGMAYSNLGTGLLGHALGLKGEKPFDELLAERVLHPLGMNDTTVTLRDDQTSRYAPGHNEKGEPTSNWDTPTLGGAGALRSSVEELLIFLRANIDPSSSPLKAALETCHTERPVAWWRRISVGASTALILSAVSLLFQWWVPIPPGSARFLGSLFIPVLICLFWKGFWSGVTASVTIWIGCCVLWGSSFGWAPAGLSFLFILGHVAWFAGYLPPPRRAMLGWQKSSDHGVRTWWHNGGTGGYASFVAFSQNPNVAVAVLSNSANSVDEIGVSLLTHVLSTVMSSPSSETP